jgi:hypothetical protein
LPLITQEEPVPSDHAPQRDAELTPDFFRSLADFDEAASRVSARLAKISTGEQLTRFFVRYASWNGRFANGVSSLVSLIGDQREMFRESGFPRAVADRSNYIASYIFDAARDEYNDHINPIRDTHRCMAQASLISMASFFQLGDKVLDEPDVPQLIQVNEAVLQGYTGGLDPKAGSLARVFAGMGYHLGSELLADREFSIIDTYLRTHHDALVQHLMRATVELAGGTHRCYAWVGVHSGHGGGVEADHFDYAIAGARAAIRFLVGERHDEAVTALIQGFLAFEKDHARFFAIGDT